MPPIALILLSLLLVSGCSSFEYRYGENDTERLSRKILGPAPAQEAATFDPLYLSPEARRQLDERIDAGWHATYKLKQLRAFLFDDEELGLEYDADATRTAMEVWDSGAGNCLALTNIFIAAARHVGLNAHYQTVEVTPTWDHSGGTMVRYEHIVASGRLGGGDEYVIDFLPEFVIGDKRARRISDTEAVKLYYSNLGAESLLAGDERQAVDYLRRSLHVDPQFSDGWNNMGAALRRQQKFELAEFAYQRALDLNPDNLSAMSNLAHFYETRGRDAEAAKMARRVSEYRRRNPYFHFYLARLLFEAGEYEGSIEFLEQSIRLKRDEPQFYEAIAESYERLGDDGRVDKYLSLAEKYRTEDFELTPRRERSHRFFTRTIAIQ